MATLGPFDTAADAREAILDTMVFAHLAEMAEVGKFEALYLSREEAAAGLMMRRLQRGQDGVETEGDDDSTPVDCY